MGRNTRFLLCLATPKIFPRCLPELCVVYILVTMEMKAALVMLVLASCVAISLQFWDSGTCYYCRKRGLNQEQGLEEQNDINRRDWIDDVFYYVIGKKRALN